MDRKQGRLHHHPGLVLKPSARLASRAASRLATLAAALVLFGAGCSMTRTEAVPGAPPGTTVVKLTGSTLAEAPPDPRTASLSGAEYEASLRRLTVRYARITVYYRTDPQPLLSERQIAEYAEILARELPKLSAEQRLKFTFTDRQKGRGFWVDMDVYREGVFLVYRFSDLATDKNQNLMQGDTPLFQAFLDAQPGQEAVNHLTVAWLKDPLVTDVREARAAVDAKKGLLAEAKDSELIGKDEAKRLEPLTERPSPSVEVWKTYWEKRRTLRKAFDQNLMDQAAYQTQVDKLNADLAQ